MINDGGLLLILRGFNFNPGAEPNDLISVRIWIDAQRAITLRHCQILSSQDVKTGP